MPRPAARLIGLVLMSLALAVLLLPTPDGDDSAPSWCSDGDPREGEMPDRAAEGLVVEDSEARIS